MKQFWLQYEQNSCKIKALNIQLKLIIIQKVAVFSLRKWWANPKDERYPVCYIFYKKIPHCCNFLSSVILDNDNKIHRNIYIGKLNYVVKVYLKRFCFCSIEACSNRANSLWVCYFVTSNTRVLFLKFRL